MWSHQRQNEALSTRPFGENWIRTPTTKDALCSFGGDRDVATRKATFGFGRKNKVKEGREASEGKRQARRGAGPLVVSPSSGRAGR